MSKQAKKYTAKEYVKGIFIIALVLGALIAVMVITSRPKPIPTYHEALEVFRSLNLETEDRTQQRLSESPNCGMQQNITANEDGIFLEFATFTSDAAANNAYASYRSYIREHEFPLDRGYGESRGNYVLYGKDEADFSYAVSRIGNTTIFATCKNEQKSIIAKVFIPLGYMKDSQAKPLSRTALVLIRLAIFAFLLLPMTFLCTRPIWTQVCRSAGKTREAVLKHQNATKKRWGTYAWLLQEAEEPQKFKRYYASYLLCFLPITVSILALIAAFFTDAAIKVFNVASFLSVAVLVFVSVFTQIKKKLKNK